PGAVGSRAPGEARQPPLHLGSGHRGQSGKDGGPNPGRDPQAIQGKDPLGRVACETAVTTGLAFVIGEITTDTYVEMRDIIRDTIEQAGYDHPGFGFDAETCGVIVSIQKQSPDIAQGVDTGGAGDQGMMFGFACDETPELMPMPIQLAHQLARQLARVRKDHTLAYLGPDGKTQV